MQHQPNTSTVARVQYGLSNEEYHALPSISKSGLDLIRRAPALYDYRRTHPRQQTPAFRWGTLVHTAILEPETVAERTVVAPEIDRRTKAGKEEWANFQAIAAGKEIVSEDEQIALDEICIAVRKHPGASRALDMIREVESSIFWMDHETGIDCRCRPDAILTNGLILDVKTTVDASPDSFARSLANYRYHVQAAFYSDGYQAAFGEKPKGFAFLAIEKEPPYLCALYVLDATSLLRGRADYQADLRTYQACMESGEWPGLSPQPVVIELPKWA
jgi:exodeoxyribonuclease VIII